MKLGFVNQPISQIGFAHGSVPRNDSSIGIVNYHFALQCKERHDAFLVSRAEGANELLTPPLLGQIPIIIVPEDRGSIALRAARKLKRLVSDMHRRDRPAFASRSYFAAYGEEVARIANEHKIDCLHVQNFFQLVPIIKEHCPRTKVHLHMQCEWLTQIDRAWVSEAVKQAEFVSGVSDFISEGIRSDFSSTRTRSSLSLME